jgi:hypothetical protein
MMELLTPEYGLLVWSILALIALVLSIAAVINILRNDKFTWIESLGWITFVIIVPIIGAILYFTGNRSRTFNKYV